MQTSSPDTAIHNNQILINFNKTPQQQQQQRLIPLGGVASQILSNFNKTQQQQQQRLIPLGGVASSSSSSFS